MNDQWRSVATDPPPVGVLVVVVHWGNYEFAKRAFFTSGGDSLLAWADKDGEYWDSYEEPTLWAPLPALPGNPCPL